MSRPTPGWDESADRRPLAALLDGLLADSTVLRAAEDAARARAGGRPALTGDEVRRHVSVFLEVLLASVTQGESALREAGRAADRLAADSVERGVDLATLLDGVAAGRRVVVAGLLATGRDLIGAEALLALVPLLDTSAAEAHDRMVIAFREAEIRRARTSRSRRSDALRHLLDDGSTAWASEAGLDPAVAYHVLVSDITTPDRVRVMTPLLHRVGAVSTLTHGVACTILTESPSATPGVLCVVSPRVRLADIPAAYAHCREALDARRALGGTGLHTLLDLVLDVAATRTPWLGAALSAEYLSAVDPADERHRTLVATALAHLESGRRGEVTARRLQVHRNTVKYRLRQLQDLLPRQAPPLDDENLVGQVKLWWAMSTWQSGAGIIQQASRP